jgi:hypothetical protein
MPTRRRHTGCDGVTGDEAVKELRQERVCVSFGTKEATQSKAIRDREKD